MNIEELIKTIDKELVQIEGELKSAEGLTRLEEVAAQYNGEYRLVWSSDLLEEIKSRPQAVLFHTKLPLLDELLGGVREQQLISICAHTKHGKTTFGMFLLDQFEELNPVMIPIEQSNEELIEQLNMNGYKIPHFLSPYKLAAKVDVDWIEQRIVEGIAKHNTKVVLIDHLGYINNLGPNGENKRENLAYRIGEVMRSLKNIAKRWNVVIILLVHISQSDESKPPTLEDIKNSSDISQESDIVMGLWRKNESKKKVRVYQNKTLVSVMANRRTGKNNSIGLSFNTDIGTYEEDNGWVESMMKIAEQELQVDDDFNSI